ACFVERDRLRAGGPVTELHAEVATIRAKRLGPHHFHLFAEEHGLAIANPEGGEQLEFVMVAWLEVRERGCRFDGNRAREGVAVQASQRVLLETILELRESTLQHRKAGGHGMPTKSMQHRRALRKTFDQVKTLDA